VRVSIGNPLKFPPDASPDEITRQLHNKVSALEWHADQYHPGD